MLFDVKTMGLTSTDTYNVNIAKIVPSLNESFDVVLHAAGKAHMVP
ncbi:MAG TPA: NAD(P)-dependent oxidoreductase, partial [Gallicola sp.]|nr:NAD(P)-dependent oxidoreductase [Gallicola sp.]